MQIKICGLTREADALLAEQLGADFLGVIMAGGPRNLTLQRASLVLGPKRHSVKRVAVVAGKTANEIASIADRLSLDVVQVHDDPTPELVHWLQSRIPCAVWPCCASMVRQFRKRR